MIHAFESDIAEEYGWFEAIILNHIYYFVKNHESNGTDFHEGSYWMFNSNKAFADTFKYVSADKIKRTLQHLRDEGLIKTGNFNKLAYDRTLWYALTEKGYAVMGSAKASSAMEENAPMQEGKIPESISVKSANEEGQNPPTNTLNNTNKPNLNNTNKEYVGRLEPPTGLNTPDTYAEPPYKKPKKDGDGFKKPTIEEVRAYCEERNRGVNPDRWFDYYTSVGWLVGKNKKMKDWKAAVRNWEKDSTPKKERRSDLDDIF